MPVQLATLEEHPESVPINALVAVAGTPMENNDPVSALELVRCIATARVIMPKSVVRLSAGRMSFGYTDQVGGYIETLGLDPEIEPPRPEARGWRRPSLLSRHG